MEETSPSRRLLTAYWAMLPVLLISGCNTPTSSSTPTTATPQATRIAEYQTDYAALPATTQKQLADGLISKGQNLKLVYLALGRPDLIVITPDGKRITWTYRNYISPVVATNKVVLGRKPERNLSASSSPLHDTMEAWQYGVLKHEVPADFEVSGLTRMKVVPKAANQSWADYGKYRLELKMAEGKASPQDLRNMNLNAQQEYREALTIPPIASPDPIKLDVHFVDQQVADAIVDDSFSAFSVGTLPLTTTATPGLQGQTPE